jgi:hypothetical protein
VISYSCFAIHLTNSNTIQIPPQPPPAYEPPKHHHHHGAAAEPPLDMPTAKSYSPNTDIDIYNYRRQRRHRRQVTCCIIAIFVTVVIALAVAGTAYHFGHVSSNQNCGTTPGGYNDRQDVEGSMCTTQLRERAFYQRLGFGLG